MTVDLNPLIVSLAPILAAFLAGLVAIVLSYAQKRLGISVDAAPQLRAVINEGINMEANRLLDRVGRSASKVDFSNVLVNNVVQYVASNAIPLLKAAGVTPDSLAQVVTAMMVAHPAIETPLTLHTATSITKAKETINSDDVAKIETVTVAESIPVK